MKDYLRDYATAAFRFYAQNGKSAEKYKKKIYDEALKDGSIREGKKSGTSSPTEAAIMRAEKAVDLKIAEIKDMEAVELTLAEFESRGRGREIILAIEHVYFKDCEDELERIKDKVHIAEIYIPASESSIYRWLKKARQLFSEKRGLRIES